MMRMLVTGANRGIGRAIAAQAVARGWQVWALTRGGDVPKGATALHADVTDRAALAAAAARISALDVLINNAGISGPTTCHTPDLPGDALMEVFHVNTVAPLLVAQAFLPALRAAGRGRILNISSQMSAMDYRKSDQPAYRASKAALNKLMQCLATDLEPHGIPVVLIDPGWVRTDMGGSEALLDATEVANGILDTATSLSIAQTGRFLTWAGKDRTF
ncbi:MAG: SDR family oxidoreductase [Paracoccus sp. (in: a-proteobacteria)]|nr:SDR family oxidoreductase [Paracoccus sp. (in: a-proteobacteria)]